MHITSVSLAIVPSVVVAQDFTVPGTWRKSNATLSRDERIAIARRAIDYCNSFYDSGAGLYSFSDSASSDDTFIDHNSTIESARHGASMLRYSAMHDLLAGTNVYQSFVTNALKRAVEISPPAPNSATNLPTGTILGVELGQGEPHYCLRSRRTQEAESLLQSDLMTETFNQVGLAAVYAYRAYNDSTMLDVARTVQQTVENATSFGPLDPPSYPGAQSAVAQCVQPGIANSILPYLFGNASSTSHLIQYGWVQSSDWAGFLALSAYVALSTTNALFEDGVTIYGYITHTGFKLVDAQTSFAHSILVYNATAGNKQDPASPIYTDAAHNFTDCAPVDAGSPSAGVYVEALSAYANLTEETTIQEQHLQALLSATTYGLSVDGILSDDRPPYLIGRGGHLAGLMDTLLRTTNQTIRDYIQAYANVQFNALQDFAINPDNQTYSSMWTAHDGDLGGAFNVYYQVEAIPALNLAIGLPPPSKATAIPPASTQPISTGAPGSHTSNGPPTAALAGGIGGGVVAFVLVILVVLLCRRRRRHSRRIETATSKEKLPGFVPEPYTVLQADTSDAGLLSSGGAPRTKRSDFRDGIRSDSEGPPIPVAHSEVHFAERERLDTNTSLHADNEVTSPETFFERIPTRHLARILHERVTGMPPGDADEYEWRLGGADRATSPPSYRSRSLR
ncbi:unnamed protein product [Peniophora sp. CBMAI 1063]|nr:unnamed protein product [Peniophora sp. CBMAI 1063]